MSQNYPGVAVVTGAASGIGRATSIAFARGGCMQLALLDLNESGLEESKSLVADIITSSNRTPNILVIKIDVTSADSVAAAFSSIKSHFNRIDYSVQCAGIGAAVVDSVSCSVELFDHQNAVNYRGLWLCTREAIRIMRDQTLDADAYPDAKISSTRAQRGSIVNISSTLALYSQTASAAYSAAKGGVLSLTRADAMDCVGHRIRVNAILPGLVDTPMTKPTLEVRSWLEEKVLPRVPMTRMGQPEEVADLCIFLAGNKASYITGQGWAADGGATAGYC